MKKLIAIALIGLVCIFGVVAYSAQQEFVGGLYAPHPTANAFTTTSVMSVVTSTDSYAWIFQPGEECNLTEVGIGVGATSTGVGNLMNIYIDSVNASSGNPTHTLYSAGGGTAVTSAALTANALNWIDISDVTITAGNMIALRTQWTSTVGTAVVWPRTAMSFGNPGSVTYATVYSLGTWTKSNAIGWSVAIKCGTSIRPIPGFFPVSAYNNEDIDSDGTNNAVALKFSVPFPTVVGGMCAYIDPDFPVTYALLSSTGATTLASFATYTAQRYNVSAGVHCYNFNSKQSIVAGTDYLLAVVTDNTGATRLNSISVTDAGNMAGLPGGTNWRYARRAAGQVLFEAEDTTKRPLIWPIFSSFGDDVGTGGGGGGTSVW